MARYLSFYEDSLARYGKRTVRLSIDAGLSCPNRDGSLGTRGCAFCAGTKRDLRSVKEQIQSEKIRVIKKWGDEVRFVAYFCMYTSTYADVKYLRQLYYEALETGVDGIAISTRADCLGNEVIALLKELATQTEVWAELGMQTVNARTIERMNRGYSHEVLDQAVLALQKARIPILLHLIVGLPGEDLRDSLRAVSYCNERGIQAVKIHQLYLEEGSDWAKEYEADPFPMLEKEEYQRIVALMIAHLNESIVIHRITGDPDRTKVIAPLWTIDKLRVIGGIQKELKEKDLWQGKFHVSGFSVIL